MQLVVEQRSVVALGVSFEAHASGFRVSSGFRMSSQPFLKTCFPRVVA